jgi:hypothetical protein
MGQAAAVLAPPADRLLVPAVVRVAAAVRVRAQVQEAVALADQPPALVAVDQEAVVLVPVAADQARLAGGLLPVLAAARVAAGQEVAVLAPLVADQPQAQARRVGDPLPVPAVARAAAGRAGAADQAATAPAGLPLAREAVDQEAAVRDLAADQDRPAADPLPALVEARGAVAQAAVADLEAADLVPEVAAPVAAARPEVAPDLEVVVQGAADQGAVGRALVADQAIRLALRPAPEPLSPICKRKSETGRATRRSPPPT